MLPLYNGGGSGAKSGREVLGDCAGRKAYSERVRFSIGSDVIARYRVVNKYQNGARNLTGVIVNHGIRSMVTLLRKVRYHGNASYPSRLTRTLGRD